MKQDETPLKETKSVSTNAKAQRAFRERLRQKGWMPYQVYILPEHKKVLDAVEKELRTEQLSSALYHLTLENLAVMSMNWTALSLYKAFSENQEATLFHPMLQENVLTLRLADKGDLRVDLAIVGNQILVSSIIVPASHIQDRSVFNDMALRVGFNTHLTNIGLDSINGEDVYVAFGQLSACAPLDNILEEIKALGFNTIEFIKMFQPFLKNSSYSFHKKE